MGGGKGGSKPTFYFYRMSIDFGLCHGPVDALNEVTIKDKSAYVGPVVDPRAIRIKKSKLFGGKEKEGGPVGIIEFYPGSYVQKMTSALASRFSGTPDTMPGYRGLCHVFFRGGTLTDGWTDGAPDPQDEFGSGDLKNPLLWIFNAALFGFAKDDHGESRPLGQNFQHVLPASAGGDDGGFEWVANNPYMPETHFRVTRLPRGLDGYEAIWPICGVDENTGAYIIAQPGEAFEQEGKIDYTRLPDANPAAMLYELKTNTDWGKGDPPSSIDIASYIAAAQTLENEHFGLSMMVSDQEKFKTVAGEILDHIKGVEFQHPETGLWTLKLIRGGYNEAGLPLLDPSNADVENVKKRLWGDTINKIFVEYTNPASEEKESIGSENLANIMIQGAVISETRDYHAIRNPWLAKMVADRDVSEASRTLTSATVYTNRTNETLLPGGVFRLTWPEEEIDEMVMRITKIDYGSATDRRIKMEVVEDVFGAPAMATAPVPSGENDEFLSFNDEPRDPDTVFIFTTPLASMLRNGTDPATADDEYPRVIVGFMVGHTAVDFNQIAVVGETTLANGQTTTAELVVIDQSDPWPLPSALVPEVRSVLPESLINEVISGDPEVGQLLVIGTSEASHELAMLDSYDDVSKQWTILRGVHDTVPEAWASGTPLRQLIEAAGDTDPTERLAGAELEYNFLPETSLGRLNLEASTTHAFTPSARPYLPLRPANVQIDGNGFGLAQYLHPSVPTTVTITWADRNRFDEDAIVPAWDDTATTPEAGQTVTIRAFGSGESVAEFEVTGLTGGTYDLDLSNLTAHRFYDIIVSSERDGLESFRSVTRTLEIERVGYGNNYGFNYGGNT